MNLPKEDKEYIQSVKLWEYTELLSSRLAIDRPEDPLAAIIAVFEQEKRSPVVGSTEGPPADFDTIGAKDYFRQHRLAILLEGWIAAAIKEKTTYLVEFSLEYFQAKKNPQAAPAPAAADAPPPQVVVQTAS